MSRISNNGRFLVDAYGRVNILRGCNVVVKIPPYTPQSVGFNERVVRFLKKSGVNVVRLGILWAGVEPQPGVYDNNYILQILETAKLLGKYGIYSLLDSHQDMYNEKFQGEGFPAWSVFDDGLPNPQNGFPQNYSTNPALFRAFRNFWDNVPASDGIGIQDHFVNAWQHVATFFRGKSFILGYNTLNEPFDVALATEATRLIFDQTTLTNFFNKIITSIRQVDNETLIFYQYDALTSSLAPINPLPNLINDPKLAQCFSQYCDTSEPRPPGCQGDIINQLNTALQIAEIRSNPFIITEWSNDSGSVADALSVRQRIDLYDQNLTSWIYWELGGYPDPTTSISPLFSWILNINAPLEGINLTNTYHECIRPYPQVIAGIPISIKFITETSVFALQYSTKTTGLCLNSNKSVIFVPKSRYPNGYQVLIEGAKILSKSKQRLIIKNNKCSHIVGVIIIPQCN